MKVIRIELRNWEEFRKYEKAMFDCLIESHGKHPVVIRFKESGECKRLMLSGNIAELRDVFGKETVQFYEGSE